ncbi:MAG: hypothetical protein OCD02_11695 [Spirochaetaceae bacterium]
MRQFDERDTLFSRIFELEEGSEKYDNYYSSKPENELIDKKLRSHSNGEFDDDVYSQKLVDSTFQFLKDIRPLAHQSKSKEITTVDPKKITEVIKKLAVDYGAVITGVADMNPRLYYSYRGRGESYGKEVIENNPYSIVFAVEMNKDQLLNAPGAKESVEVVRGYSRVALIGMMISYYIRALGYDANCHMDGETSIPMVPVAYRAGLGEIGRIGILINKDYGARIRLGAVTTNLPLLADSPKPFGLKKVCRTCKKCSKICPSEAIDNSTEEPWHITSDTKCFKSWKKFGTDCGLCLVSCPYSN